MFVETWGCWVGEARSTCAFSVRRREFPVFLSCCDGLESYTSGVRRHFQSTDIDAFIHFF